MVELFIKPNSTSELNISGKLKSKILSDYEIQKNSKDWILETPIEKILHPVTQHL
jgi:hypothetical protein